MLFKQLFRPDRQAVRFAMPSRLVWTSVSVLTLLLASLLISQMPVVEAAGTVSGQIFDDSNFNGVLDTGETVAPIGGTLTFFPTTGASFATPVAGGTFTTNVPDGLYRVELSGLTAGAQPSYGLPSPGTTNSGSVVRFVSVTTGSTNALSFGVTRPGDTAQCATVGNNAAGQPNFINVGVPYHGAYTGGFLNSVGLADAQPSDLAVTRMQTNQQANSPTNSPAHVTLATLGDVGATFGLEYARANNGTTDLQKTFVAAYNKRATKYGPGGSGAVYAISNSNGPGPFPINQWINVAGGAGHSHDYTYGPLPTGKIIFDQASSDVIGKAGLGAITINESETVLYAMALGDRQIYRYTGLTSATGSPTPTNSVINLLSILPTGFILPNATGNYGANDPLGACRQDDFRPFAVKYYQGKLYIGAVCSAESTVPANAPDDAGLFSSPGVFAKPLYQLDAAGQRNRLRAYVFAMNGDGTGGATSVLSSQQDGGPGFALDYLSDPVWEVGGGSAGNVDYNRIWLPWRNYNGNLSLTDRTRTRGFSIYPQPMLSNLDFDLNGNMIIAFRDRNGDQASSAPANATSSSALPGDQLVSSITGGDMLRATPNGTNWRMETDLQYPTNTSQQFNLPPPQQEFFTADRYPPVGHYEVSNGSVAQFPDQQVVLMSAFDPYSVQTGGVFWMDETTGGLNGNKKEEIYPQTSARFGKANGLGDLAMLCSPARPQIGNRIWIDNNHNGIQDPDDVGIAGVKVELLDANGQPKLAEATGQPITAVTAADGTYYFPVALKTQYQVRVLSKDATLAPGQTVSNKALLSDKGYDYTLPNVGSVSANSKADPTTGTTGLSTTLGGAQVDHTLDIGFWLAQVTPTPTPTPTPTSTATPTPTPPRGPTPTSGPTPTPNPPTATPNPPPPTSPGVTPTEQPPPPPPPSPTAVPPGVTTPPPGATTPPVGAATAQPSLPNTGRAEVGPVPSGSGSSGGVERWLLIGVLWAVGGSIVYRVWRRPRRR